MLRTIFGPSAENDSFALMDQRKRSKEAEFPAPPIDHALEAVVHLQQRSFLQGIVSNSHHEFIVSDLCRLGFPMEAFFRIQATEDADVHKPDPRVFDPMVAVLATYGIRREEIRYIGDSLHDGLCAQAAAIGFIGVASGDTSVESFQVQGM